MNFRPDIKLPDRKTLELPSELEYGVLDDNNLQLLVKFKKETNKLDYKLEYPTTNEHLYEIVKDVSAFLNSGGGYIVVGVNNGLEPIGIDKEHEKDFDPTRLSSKLSKYISPSVELHTFIGNFKEKTNVIRIAIIYIAGYETRPHIINNNYSYADIKGKNRSALYQGTIYVRRQSASQPCDPDSWELLINNLKYNMSMDVIKEKPDTLMDFDRKSLFSKLF